MVGVMAVTAEGPLRKKKLSYDANFKLKVVDYAENATSRGVAAKFFVDEKPVREWRQKKANLLVLPDKKKRLYGGGWKAPDPNIEEVLCSWIGDLRASNL